ncbi:MAG: DUF1203 domain-containing protein [Pseudomonadota bacterium]
MPDILTTSPDSLVKGYAADDRIAYGTGAVIPAHRVRDRVAAVFTDPNGAYAHLRSALNNCYQVRIDHDA